MPLEEENLNNQLEQDMADTEAEDFESPLESQTAVSYYGQDFDVFGLVHRLKRDTIVIPNFGNQRDSNLELANFQRSSVWTKTQKQRFIESILLGYPIPNIFLFKQKDEKLLVLDGQQRLTTLKEFLANEFKLANISNSKFYGKDFNELENSERTKLENAYMRAIVLEVKSTSDDSKSAVYQIFERLNSGGTQLNSHEIRIAIFAGDVMDYIHDLNLDPQWRIIYGKEKLDIRGRDHELITRIFALYYNWERYKKPLRQFLNDFYDQNSEKDEKLESSGEAFKKCCELLSHETTRKFLMRGNRVSPAVVDAIFVALMSLISSGKNFNNACLESKLKALQSDEEFRTASTDATTDEKSVKQRIKIAKEILGA